MITAAEKRLARVADVLTPKQAVLVWMSEAHAHGSFGAYVASLQGAPTSAYPLYILGAQMEKAVRTARPKQPEAQVWPAVRWAVRDAGFLYYLILDLNHRVLENKRATWLHIALVAEMLRSTLEPDADHQRMRCSEQVQAAAQSVYIQQGVVDAVAAHYLDGTSPLFPEVAETVAAQVQQMEDFILFLNDTLLWPARPRSKRAPAASPLDAAELRRSAAPAIQDQTALAVDLAKAAAWRLIGEDEQGFALLERQVWGG